MLTAAHADPPLSPAVTGTYGYATDPDLIDEDWDVDVDRDGTNGLILDDWIDHLSSIAEEIGLPHDTNTVFLTGLLGGSIQKVSGSMTHTLRGTSRIL